MERTSTQNQLRSDRYGSPEAVRDITPVLDADTIADIQAARGSYQFVEREEFKRQYASLRAEMYGKSKVGNRTVRKTGDVAKDTETLRRVAAVRASQSADTAVAEALDDTLMRRLGYERAVNGDDDEYNRILSAATVLATVNDDEWYGEEGDSDSLLGRIKRVNTQARQQIAPTDEEEPAERRGYMDNAILDEVKADVAEVRKKYGALLGERSKKLMFESASTKEEIAEKQQELSDLLGALATEMMLDLENLGTDSAEITRLIDQFIARETDKVVSDMEASRAHEFEKRSRFTQFLVGKWAEWGNKDGDKLFTKGRFKKAALFALPSAGVGVAFGILAAPALATLGTAAAVGTGAFMAGRAIARRLASTKLDSAANAQTVAGVQAQEIREQVGELGDNTDLFDMLNVVEERATYYRHRNTKRLVGGMAISLTAGLLSSSAVEALDHFDVGTKLYHGAENAVQRAKEWWDNSTTTAPGTGTPSGSGQPPYWPGNNPPQPPHTPGDPTPGGGENEGKGELILQKTKEWTYGADERRISNGEGWYQTFREMGVDAGDRSELLKDVGPHLHEKGLAYWDKNAHEWRMNMTENGKLPKSAIRYIAETAHEHGIDTNYDKFVDATASVSQEPETATVFHEFSSGAQHISDGEGFYHELSQMGVPASDQAEVLQEAAPQLYDQGIAYEMNDSLPGINMTPDHVMPQESLETLHQAAIETNVGNDLTVMHEGIVFDEATAAASTTTADNSGFLVSDFGKSYDVDAQSYYNALKGVDRSHWQALLNEAAPKLQSVRYGGASLTYHDNSGWHFREVNNLPPEARAEIRAVANKHNWVLAS